MVCADVTYSQPALNELKSCKNYKENKAMKMQMHKTEIIHMA